MWAGGQAGSRSVGQAGGWTGGRAGRVGCALRCAKGGTKARAWARAGKLSLQTHTAMSRLGMPPTYVGVHPAASQMRHADDDRCTCTSPRILTCALLLSVPALGPAPLLPTASVTTSQRGPLLCTTGPSCSGAPAACPRCKEEAPALPATAAASVGSNSGPPPDGVATDAAGSGRMEVTRVLKRTRSWREKASAKAWR